MLLQANVRLKVYSVISFATFSLMMLELPAFSVGTCLGIMAFIAIGLWVELGDYITDKEGD